jgi:hypothetical protein
LLTANKKASGPTLTGQDVVDDSNHRVNCELGHLADRALGCGEGADVVETAGTEDQQDGIEMNVEGSDGLA